MNNDLISRRELKNALFKVVEPSGIVYAADVVKIIDNAPTVDVKPFASITFDKEELNRIVEERVIEPIKNGELVIKEERPQGEWQLHGMIYYCSECGHECGESGDNFCGNCGADMRGEENERYNF